MTAWDMWFDMQEAEREDAGDRGVRLDELAEATGRAYEDGRRALSTPPAGRSSGYPSAYYPPPRKKAATSGPTSSSASKTERGQQ